MKTIKYYRLRPYGREREYIHPDCVAEAKALMALTGRKTLNPTAREQISALTGGEVTFEEVVAPQMEDAK